MDAAQKIKVNLAAQNVILPDLIKSRVSRGRNINLITQLSSKSQLDSESAARVHSLAI